MPSTLQASGQGRFSGEALLSRLAKPFLRIKGQRMNTVELLVYIPDDLQEYLIAELSELDFDSFLQEEGRLKAYIASSRWDEVKREQIGQWLVSHGVAEPVVEHVVPAQNWNQRWEETIQPIQVGIFLVKPTWAEVPEESTARIVLEIDPKMSFGTGYHESTRLALRFLPEMVQGSERVLDVGTGTGILAIAAVKLGASEAVAVDIDEWAQQNAVENLYLNDVADRVSFRAGGLEVVPESGFDLLLANINRNVLLDYMPSFYEKLGQKGYLMLSGLLQQDRETMLAATVAQGLIVVSEATEGIWWAVVLKKP